MKNISKEKVREIIIEEICKISDWECILRGEKRFNNISEIKIYLSDIYNSTKDDYLQKQLANFLKNIEDIAFISAFFYENRYHSRYKLYHIMEEFTELLNRKTRALEVLNSIPNNITINIPINMDDCCEEIIGLIKDTIKRISERNVDYLYLLSFFGKKIEN